MCASKIMPIFSFVCTSCKKEEDRLVSSSSVNEQKCSCKEDAKMEKVNVKKRLKVKS